MKSQIKKVEGKKKVIFVGLSGGVDSAVSAAILQREGYEVHGVFIKAWTPEWLTECTWKEDRRSAMRAAAVLGIPFHTLNLEKEYKKEVVDYMIAEYRAGRTPNPDVMCNKEIKFGHFLKWALKNGANAVATGHYARVFTSPYSRRGRDEVRVRLLEAKDKNKDQSYFLWTLTQDQLKQVLFPVGSLLKEEVRKLAKKFGLPQATRKDSQGLCFLGQVDMKEFLSRYIATKPGSVLNANGEKIGYHPGALFFTIGERHGFTITEKTPNDEILYVVSKDINKNEIVVASKIANAKVLRSRRSNGVGHFDLQFSSQNTTSETGFRFSNIFCRLRYRQDKIACKVEGDKVIFDAPQLVSPGQSIVFYKDEICLGGGVIL